MIVQCPECGKDVADIANFCAHCGHPLKLISKGLPTKKNKSAIFQFVAIGSIVIALLTPKIIASIPCLVIIIAGIVSLARNEPRRFISILSIVAGIAIMGVISADLTNIGKDLQKIGSNAGDEDYIAKMELGKWDWKVERYGYSYIRGRIKNNGIKTVRYFKITARYMDKDGNVLDSAYTNDAEDLPPGMSKAFEIMHKDSPEYKKANIFVSEVRTK